MISRSVAQDTSQQIFYPRMIGDAAGFGHVQCDSILMGQAKIQSIPALTANHPDAQLIHEAAIGRIAGDQILKLMTLGPDGGGSRRGFSMAFLDEREDAPTPEKRGSTTSREDPDLGKNPGPGPLGGGERHPPHPYMEKDAAEGIMMIPQEQPAKQYGTVHGGMLVAFADTIAGHSLVPPRPGVRHPGEHRELPAAGGGAYLFCRATPVQVGGADLRGVRRAAQ